MTDTGFDLAQVLEVLGTVYDPEIPISIVDLGLVYRCEEVATADRGRTIEIDLSVTAPSCGMGDVLRAEAERVVAALPGVDHVVVQLVFDPPWGLERITEAGRLELGLL